MSVQRVELDVFFVRALPNGRERAVGRVAGSGPSGIAGERIVVAETRPNREPWQVCSTTLDEALALAEGVVAGHDRVITEPKTMMRLAAALIGMVAAIQSPASFLPPAPIADAAEDARRAVS